MHLHCRWRRPLDPAYCLHHHHQMEDHSTKKWKRTYVACLNCRVRKVKCDLGSAVSPTDRCARCVRERRDCVFVTLKKRHVSKVREEEPVNEPEPEKEEPPKHFSTMEGALVFLASAAGKIATADERDKIDARLKHAELERARYSPYALAESLARDSSGSNIASNTSLVVLPLAGTPELLIPPYTNRPFDTRLAMPPAENSYAMRPKSTSHLADIEYIGDNGILTVDQAEHLVQMFFATMHPFFPHIPKFLHLPKVLLNYPILLCAILTISLRYHSLGLDTAEGVAKNIEIHDRLWLYVQRLISQTVWAEASTRSIGTVFAFLLFTEWNPRAIHWRWSDYANKADDLTETREVDAEVSVATGEPAGLGAMRRLYRMAWMLIGSAVRLAQDTGFMELSAKTFLATHIAEINSVMNMKRRSMLGHSLAEVDLDTSDISEEEMEKREDNEYKVLRMLEDQNRSQVEAALHFTKAQRAQVELLQIMSLGHESLYGFKAQLGLLNQRQNLSVLNIMSPMINAWGRKYKLYLVPLDGRVVRKFNPSNLLDSSSKAASKLAQCFENESFIFEFNYTKLYIYSLALSPLPKTRQNFKDGKLSLKLDEISKSAKYIEQAFNSAHEILQVAHRVHKLKMLRFMPVRWVTRIVRAVAFMVKCYLTITAHKLAESGEMVSSDNFDSTILSLSLISIEEIIQSIQRAAITIRDCSPDELHLCTRYSNVLMYLYSEMRAKFKKTNEVEMEDPNVDEEAQPEREPKPPSQPSTFDSTRLEQGRENYETDTAYAGLPFPGDNELMDWFVNNRNIGLDFVGPWTELIEQQLEGQNFSFDDGLHNN